MAQLFDDGAFHRPRYVLLQRLDMFEGLVSLLDQVLTVRLLDQHLVRGCPELSLCSFESSICYLKPRLQVGNDLNSIRVYVRESLRGAS